MIKNPNFSKKKNSKTSISKANNQKKKIYTYIY